MTDNTEMFELLHGIVESIDPMQTNADWGREFGQAVFESGDEDLIVYVLADAGEKYWSSEGTKLRKRARDAAFAMSSSDNGELVKAVQMVLDFAIVVPGFPRISLGRSSHRFLVDACAATERHIKGSIQNLRMMERARDVSAPWPDEAIEDLIARGDLTADMLVVSEDTGS